MVTMTTKICVVGALKRFNTNYEETAQLSAHTLAFLGRQSHDMRRWVALISRRFTQTLVREPLSQTQ